MSLERVRSRRVGYNHEIVEESRSARALVAGGPDDDLMILEVSRAVREDGLRRMYLEQERELYRYAGISTPTGEYRTEERVVLRKRAYAEKDP